MPGTPVSHDQWIRINAIAGGLLLAAALVPLLLTPVLTDRRARPVLLVICWVVAVGCASHALIGIVQRIASLSGALTIEYPFWLTVDRREADLQALFFNEPWFLVEGLLWAGMAWTGPLRESERLRRWWTGSVIGATAVATTVGLLSAFGVIGSWIVG